MTEATEIALLFSRDPLKHTDQDIDAMIAKMRESRHLFNSGAAPKAKAKPKSDIAQAALDLDDLNL